MGISKSYKRRIYSIILSLLLMFPVNAHAIGIFYDSLGTDKQTTSTSDQEALEVDASLEGDLLIWWTGAGGVNSSSTEDVHFVAEVNDVTVMDHRLEPSQVSSNNRSPTAWIYMHENATTATSNYQWSVRSEGGSGVTMESGSKIMGIDLTNGVEGTDWMYANAEPGTDDFSPTEDAWTDCGTITIPAGQSGEDYAFWGRYRCDINHGTVNSCRIRAIVDSTTAWGGDHKVKAHNASNDMPLYIQYIYNVPDASSHTIDVQYYVDGSSSDVEDCNAYAFKVSTYSDDYFYEQSETRESHTTDSLVLYAGASESETYAGGDYATLGWGTVQQETTSTSGWQTQVDTFGTWNGLWQSTDGEVSDESDLAHTFNFYFAEGVVAGAFTNGVKYKHTNNGSTRAALEVGSYISFLEEAEAGADPDVFSPIVY